MPTMQAFYDKLSANQRQPDHYWDLLVKLAKTPLTQLRSFSDLVWYLWGAE